MSLSSATNRMDYTGSGSTDTYSYTFKIFSSSDLVVTKRLISSGAETVLTLTTDYTVTGAGETAGGSITLVAGNLASTYHLTIQRVMPLTQELDIRNQGDYFPERTEDAFDKATMVDQQQQESIDRALKVPATITGFDPTLPATLTPGTTFIVNVAGDGIIEGPDATTIAAASTSAAAAAASASAASTSATNAATSATNAASSATAAASSATAASASATAAAASASSAVLVDGTRPLTAEWDAGNFAIKVSAIKSNSGNIAGTGKVRLSNGDTIVFRNVGNTADIAFGTGSSNNVPAYGSIDLVNLSTAQTLTNKTLTTPVISSISNTGTVTLPTATCTLVGKDTTDVLTNKTLTGNTAVNLISGSGTLTLNTTGTITVPNATDTLVGKTTTDTLTNKTVQFPTSGGTPTSLDYYEEGTFSCNFTAGAGVSGANTSKTVAYTRIGKIVVLTFPACSNMTAGTTANNFSTASGTVPSRLRPVTASPNFAVLGQKNSVNQTAPFDLTIATDGTVQLYVDGGGTANWTATQTNNGFYSTAVSYTIQ